MHKIFCIFIALNFATVAVLSIDYPDLNGANCEECGCSNNTMQKCIDPSTETVCYCDEFCGRTDGDVCCSDYESFCKQKHPPIIFGTCINGIAKINCNECPCQVVEADLENDLNTENLCTQHRCLIEPDLIDEINTSSDSNGWQATNYSEFWGRTLDDGIQLRLGTFEVQQNILRLHSVANTIYDESIPVEFDGVTEWPMWISSIEDQLWCGASWAISTTTVASDRFAIQSKGKITPILSSQQLLSCATPKSQRCKGGRIDIAWNYIRKYGIVDDKCFPYVGESDNKTCPFPSRSNVKIGTSKCPSGPLRSVKKYKMGPPYKLANEREIMIEILLSGPVQATMEVYQDLFSYKSGIYQHNELVEEYKSGYHSVRIVGWGEEDTANGVKKFWKVANSWGSQWGEDGYFRIIRGINECEIENFVLGAWPVI